MGLPYAASSARNTWLMQLHIAPVCDDITFRDAGKVGLWTKADSVTYFDDLTIATADAR